MTNFILNTFLPFECHLFMWVIPTRIYTYIHSNIYIYIYRSNELPGYLITEIFEFGHTRRKKIWGNIKPPSTTIFESTLNNRHQTNSIFLHHDSKQCSQLFAHNKIVEKSRYSCTQRTEKLCAWRFLKWQNTGQQVWPTLD